ncbi:MAG: hypothetical protein VB111_00680 [Clostridiaceae bacterium]|nr:hypothetical protein [Clostridiaceae bacterium]
MMKRLQSVCLFGALFCCGCAVIQAVTIFVGAAYIQEFVWIYLALFSAGYGTAFLCIKPSVPVLRAVLFIGLLGAMLAAWRMTLPYADGLLASGHPAISALYMALTVKGGLFFILGALTRFESPFIERFGRLWPGLFLVAGALLFSELCPNARILENLLTILTILFILFSIFRQWLIQTCDIFTSRGVELPEVRKRIMRTGLITASGLFLFIVGTVAFRKQIWSLACLLMDGINALVRFVLWLLSLLFRNRESGTVEEGFGFMPMDPHPSSYPWVVFLQYFFGSIAVLCVFYWLLIKTGTAMRSILRRLFAWLAGLFVSRADKSVQKEQEFYDTVEICPELPKNRASIKEQTLAELLRLIKDEHDPVKLVRIAYRILIIKLCERDVKLQNSDTTREILKKALARLGGDKDCAAIEQITFLYEKTRYGDQIPLNGEVEKIKDTWERGPKLR